MRSLNEMTIRLLRQSMTNYFGGSNGPFIPIREARAVAEVYEIDSDKFIDQLEQRRVEIIGRIQGDADKIFAYLVSKEANANKARVEKDLEHSFAAEYARGQAEESEASARRGDW